ncbi:MAG TPA: tetratricopeptide repeat protein [Tepidisphaeraceae bacterium]
MIGATVLALWPVCAHNFTTWDDNFNVSQNPYLNPVTGSGVAHFWTTPHMALYIPITYTVWGALAAVARMDAPTAQGIWLNASTFHTANLIVHVIAVLFAYQLLLALVRRRWPACAGALLFALHPVQVESVAWVAGMKDVLCGALSLLALWQYVRFAQLDAACDQDAPSRRQWIHYGIATLAFTLALFAKPSAMTLPLVAATIDWLLIRRSWRRIGAALLPWLALAAACGVVAHAVQPVAAPLDGGRVWARPFLAGAALAFYLYKLVAPVWLAIQYHYSPQVLLAGRWIWFAWTIPAAVAVGVIVAGRRWRWLAAGAAIFVLATLPVLGLVAFQFERLSLTADHYLYFAMIGPAMILAFALGAMPRQWVKAAVPVCAAVFVLLGVRSMLQAFTWQDSRTLFEHELAVNPHSETASNNLALLALTDNHPQEAESLARQSIAAQPDQGEAYNTLAIALLRQGRPDEAMVNYRKAIKNDPNQAAALASLGGMIAQSSQKKNLPADERAALLSEAEQLCRRAVDVDPTFVNARLNLAQILTTEGRIPDAMPEAEAAVRMNPTNPNAQGFLGMLLVRSGRQAEGMDHLREAQRLSGHAPPPR